MVEIVKKHIETRKNKEDGENNSVLDKIIDSEVYNMNIKKIANDMIMILLGATETSRNTTITGLCHYAKDSASLQRARAEIL